MVLHIPGIINPSDLFTKEIKDAAHYRRLRDTMMVSLSNFMTHGHVVPVALPDPNLSRITTSSQLPRLPPLLSNLARESVFDVCPRWHVAISLPTAFGRSTDHPSVSSYARGVLGYIRTYVATSQSTWKRYR